MPRSAERIEIRALTPERWRDLEALFGKRGACGGCWCMFWRQTSAEFARRKGESNRRALERLVRKGDPSGLLAYSDGAPVGWVAVAPRDDFPRLGRSRILQPVDDRPVWSVPCFFVTRSHRGTGLTVDLLRAAVEHAARNGAWIVEGYPVEPARRQADVFVYTGIASAFRRAGFQEVARRSPTRPIMRYQLGSRPI